MPKGELSQVMGEGMEKSYQGRARSRSLPTPPLLMTVLMPSVCPCPVLMFNSNYSVPGRMSRLLLPLLACKSPTYLVCVRRKVTREQTTIIQPWFVFLWTFKVYPVSFDVKTTPAPDKASEVKVFRSVLITPDSSLLKWCYLSEISGACS